MKVVQLEATYEIHVGPGEVLELPEEFVRQFGEGTWIVTITGKEFDAEHFRDHSAFFAGYGPEDEGLYDDPVAE